MGIEPTSSAWKADILADVLYPQLQEELYHNFLQLSSMNLGAAAQNTVQQPFCQIYKRAGAYASCSSPRLAALR